MKNIPVVVLVSDPFLHLLKPFAYLFNIYWSSLQEVIIGGYTPPDFKLPDNFRFRQIAPRNFPKEKYSDGMIIFFRKFEHQHFVLLLEDYFLSRKVDNEGINTLADYCAARPNLLRCDLTTDRLYNGQMVDDHESFGHYDIIESPHESEYQMSFQAGIWNRDLLLELLVPGKTPWEVEIHTSPPERMRVIGTRQNPVKYANIMLKGEVQEHEIAKIPEPHQKMVRKMLNA